MSSKKKSGNALIDFTAGGVAGCCEALSCHPLDTIKVRMQLQGKAIAAARSAIETVVNTAVVEAKAAGLSAEAVDKAAAKARAAASEKHFVERRGFVATGAYVFRKDGVPGLYRGLGAVIAGITPKMAIRFWSFEELKRLMTSADGKLTTWGIFMSGIGAGVIEAVAVVNPTEVVKIRLQTQSHSLADATMPRPKYRNAGHALYTIIREEGFGAIYRGVTLTAARQATNQGTNFTVYTLLREKLNELQPQFGGDLPGWQTSLVGLTSGALGPFSNAPLDVVKTRVQREGRRQGESGIAQGLRITRDLIKHEGSLSLWRGITPRVMRVAPGQAVTFTVYERVRSILEHRFAKPTPLT